MRNFNCYVSSTNGWINLNKINTYREYLRNCDAYFGTKYKQPSFKIVLGFGLEPIIAKDLTLSESNFNLFQEYKNWNDVMKEAFNAFLDYYRNYISNPLLHQFTLNYVGKFESKEDFAMHHASIMVTDWKRLKKYIDIKKYAEDLFEEYDFLFIKHPTNNYFFVFSF